MKVVNIFFIIKSHFIKILKELLKIDNKYGLTNRIRISNAIDKELWKNLKEYSKESGVPVSRLLDKSIQMFLDSLKKK